VIFASSLLCGVIYAQLPRQVKVDKKGLFNTITQRFSKSKIDEFYKHKIINFQMLKTEIVVKGRRHTSCSSPPPQT